MDTPALSPLSPQGAPAAKRPRHVCPLCEVEEVCLETAGASQSDNKAMRRIMAIELTQLGIRPDAVIYADIAEAYNHQIRAPMLKAGLVCPEWTPRAVRVHFEEHVDLVPRRVVARHIRRLERLSTLVDEEVDAACAPPEDEDAPPLDERVDPKLVKKQIDLSKATVALAKEYRNFQREDQAACGVEAILRSVQLGQTSAQDAQRMLEAAALARCANGSVEMPRASELFD